MIQVASTKQHSGYSSHVSTQVQESHTMAVKTSEGLSEPFECVMGVKGCPLSPTLFGLYWDDLEQVFRVHHDLLDFPRAGSCVAVCR